MKPWKDASVYTLNQYEKVLKKHFPVETREMYIQYVQKNAMCATSRKWYQDLMRYTAMMDELKKAGF